MGKPSLNIETVPHSIKASKSDCLNHVRSRARRFAFLNFRSLGTLSFYDHRLSKFHTDRNHEFPSPKNIRSKNNHCEIVSSSESVCGKFFKMVFPKFATLSKIDLQPFHHLGVWLQLIYTYRWHGTSFRNFYKFNAKHSPPPAVLPIDAFFRDLNFLSVQVQTSFWIKMEIFQNAIKYSPQKRTSGTYKTGTPGRGDKARTSYDFQVLSPCLPNTPGRS